MRAKCVSCDAALQTASLLLAVAVFVADAEHHKVKQKYVLMHKKVYE